MSDTDAWDRAAEHKVLSPESISGWIDELGVIGGGVNGSVTRPGVSTLEREAQDLVANWLQTAGYAGRRDALGTFCSSVL